MSTKKEWISLAIVFSGSILGLLGVLAFNKYILMSLPLIVRMVAMIAAYYLICVIPIIVMKKSGNKFSDYGFTKEKAALQVVTGIGLGLALSLIFTLLPHLIGMGEWVNNGKHYQHLWQFAYDFLYYIAAVACVEEFVFRGILYKKLNRVTKNQIAAVAISSVLFGLFHLLGGNIIQVVTTAILGIILCAFRLKIKNCSTLSLIIAHGVYDAMITVWNAVFLNAN